MNFQHVKPETKIDQLIEQLQAEPDTDTWYLEINRIANELLDLAGVDLPIWGVITTRPAAGKDNEAVTKVGRVVFCSTKRPSTYREAQEILAYYYNPKARWVVPYTCRIVPFEAARQAREDYLAEVEAKTERLKNEKELLALARSNVEEEVCAQ